MKAPGYLLPVLSGISIKEDYQINATLSPEGIQQFHILTQGRIEKIDKTLYLLPDDDKEQTYLQVIIQPIGSDKQYLVYNGKIHGYDNLFCEKHKDITTPLKKIELNGSDIFTGSITLAYGVDYEEERGEYDIDENGMVEVLNREEEKIPWEQIKEEGYDWITIEFKNEKGDPLEVDFELA